MLATDSTVRPCGAGDLAAERDGWTESGATVVKPGVYKHKGNLYRVLFDARWRSALPPTENGDVLVGCETDGWPEAFAGAAHSDSAFLTVKWSGNNTSVEHLDTVVIYVALYGDGRVSARTVTEFEEMVQQPVHGNMQPRFEWVGP